MVNKENSGVLFTNRRKKHEKAPDYTGEIKINGKDLRLAGWINESKQGNRYLSLKVSDGNNYNKKDEPLKQDDFVSDEIPF